MKFLVDEDVPLKLLKVLLRSGHDAVRAEIGSSDLDNALRAKREDRILVTLDKDLANPLRFPPSEFNIVRIHIHPPYAEPVIEAFQKLLRATEEQGFSTGPLMRLSCSELSPRS